jgi:putrescine transport system substrate-binding protein
MRVLEPLPIPARDGRLLMRFCRETWLAACLALLAAACSREAAAPGGGRDVADVADVTRTLNVYNWSDFIDPSVVTNFEKEFGIKVHYDVYETNEMMEAKLLAGHTNYDVVVPGGSFFEKEIKAGVYQKLDKAMLPNLKNLDTGAVQATAVLDPGNEYGVDYTWLVTVGLGYDAAKIEKRLAGAPLDSWRLLFDPRVVSKFQDCGVSVLDSPDDVVSAALSLLGKDPNSESLEDLARAEQMLAAIRPYLRIIDSARYFADLANGDLCLALGWSGDFAQARKRAAEAGKGVTIVYSVPKEGSLSIVDVLAIPADAPHAANAHRFINYLLRPDVAAKNAMAVTYASGVKGSVDLVSESLRSDPAVYPSPEARARLTPMRARSQEFTRALMRMWTRFKTGQ